MRRWIRKIALLAAALVLTATMAAAYEAPTDFTDQTLEAAMEDFMAAYGLDEGNFSLSYYHPATGEAYAFHDEAFMVAASTFKVPLNMYYYELERDGELASDAYIDRAGTTLDDAHYESLVWSNNEVSIGLLYTLGDFRTYKTLMRKYFTMADDEIDPVYYVDNYYCTRMMMDALKYLYDHSEDFEEMLGYMDEAQPGQYFERYIDDCAVAQKYGLFEGAVNNVGIVYTPEPFLLAVYTQDVDGEKVVGRAAELCRNYTLWLTAQRSEPVEEQPAEEPPEPENSRTLEIQVLPKEEPEERPIEEAIEEPVEEPEPPATEPDPEPESAFEWWMVAVCLGVFFLGGGAALLILRPSRLRKLEEEYDEEYEEKLQK